MSVTDMRDPDFVKREVEPALVERDIQDAEFVERTPDIIAAEICQIADQTRKMVLNSSIEIGKRLCEAKEMIPHGEWGNWLEHSVNFKQSTANNLMKIYTEYGDIQGQLWGASAKSQTFGNLTYSQAVALLAVPAEEREEFVEKNDVENMSTRELQEAIKARDEALAAKEAAEKEMEDAIKARDSAREELSEAVKNRENVIDGYLKRAQHETDEVKKQLKVVENKLKLEKNGHDKLMAAADAEKKEQQEEIERLKELLDAAEAKETVSEEAQKEIEEAQEEINMLRAQLKKAESLGAERLAEDEDTARFKILFETVQSNFSDLKDAALSIREEAAREKRLKAIKKLLEVLLEAMDE